MTVQDHLRIFRDRWTTIVAAMIVGVVAAGALFLLQPTQYTAFLQMYVSSPIPASSESSFLSAAQVAQERVQSYTELATSPRVTGEVVARLRLPETPDELAGQITATATDKSVVMSISVTADTAEQSARIADAVGDSISTTVDDLERPATVGAIAPIAVRAVQPAPVPTEPSSLGAKRLIGIGLLVGLAIGVGLALARNALDNSVTTAEQLTDLTGSPNLGSIVANSQIARSPLVVQSDPLGRSAEDFKRLRTNVGFVDAANPHKVLLITSALPGEGKTTTSVNLAAALASAGNRVLLIEADLRLPRASDLLDVDRGIGLTSLLSRRAGVADAVQHHGPGQFDVLPSGPLPPNPSELLASQQMHDLVADLRNRYELVLIDTSPVLPVTDAAALAPFTDGVVLVCRYQRTTTAQVTAASAAIRAVDSALRGTVLTMVDQSAVKVPGYGSAYRSEAGPAPVKPAVVVPRQVDQPTQTMSPPYGRPREDGYRPSPGPGPKPHPTPSPTARHRNGHRAGSDQRRN